MSVGITTGNYNYLHNPATGSKIATSASPLTRQNGGKMRTVGFVQDTAGGVATVSSNIDSFVKFKTLHAFPFIVAPMANVGAGDIVTENNGTNKYYNVTFNSLNTDAQSIEVGEYVITARLGLGRVLISNGNSIRIGLFTNSTDNMSFTGGIICYKVDQSLIAHLYGSKLIAAGYTATLRKIANTSILGGASKGDQINKVESIRTRRVGTAIRAGNWNEFTGKFTSAPTNAHDTASGQALHNRVTADTAPGRSKVTFSIGGALPVSTFYAK